MMDVRVQVTVFAHILLMVAYQKGVQDATVQPYMEVAQVQVAHNDSKPILG